MLRKIKKEPEPPVVTVDSDSDNEFIQVYKDDVATEVSLENNRIMIADLVALFPNFHGLQVVGSGVNRLLSKTKHSKKGYFPAPEPGWAAVKILVLVVEPSPLESTLSTPRSTPVESGTAAENVKPAKDDKPPKEDVPPPAAVTPVRVTDEDIFDRFNVSDMEELLYLPQFYRAPDKDFLKYRDRFLEVFRGPIMALGRDSFNLPFLYDLFMCRIDVSTLLSSLEGIKAMECDVCGEAFVEPQSAFKHYCSISHGEKYLTAKNCYANEIVDILKSAKERSLFPPPMYPPVQQAVPTPVRPALPSLMANIIHPAAVAIPPQTAQFIPPPKLVNTCPLMTQQRQTKWDQRPAPVQLPPSFQQPAPQSVVRIPISFRPTTVAPQQHQPYSNFQKNNVGGNFAQNPVPFRPMQPSYVYRQTYNYSENANNNDAGAVAKNWNLNHATDQSSAAPSNAIHHSSAASSNTIHGKRKRLDDSSEDEKEVPRTSRKPLAEQQPSSSRPKKSRHGEDDEEPQRPAASNLQSSSSRSKKSSSNSHPLTSSGVTIWRPDNDSEEDKSHPEPQPRSSRTKIPASADTKTTAKTKKKQVVPESSDDSDSEPAARVNRPIIADPQPCSSRSKNTSSSAATKTTEKSKKKIVVQESSDSDSSDFEAIAHVNRPIKGEFGEETIGRTPQISEKELLFHFNKVKSITELKKLKNMRVPHLIHDLDDFHKFQNFAIEHLRNVLVKASKTPKLMYTLFMASKSDVTFKTLDSKAKTKCSMCNKEELTLKHILSKKHVFLYREKYFSDPEEIMVMLEPKNQNFYVGDDERPMVLQNFNVHSYEGLKSSPQFSRNLHYPHNNSAFVALKDALIERLKQQTYLRIDPRFFRVELMLFLKYEANKKSRVLKSVFEGFERECKACTNDFVDGIQMTSWNEYMKHIVSKNHIRKELTQKQINFMINAMRVIKETPNGFKINEQQNGPDSSDDSSPPDDPVNHNAVRMGELRQELKALEKFKSLTQRQKDKMKSLKNEIASLKM